MTYSPLIPVGSIPPVDQVTDLVTNFSQYAVGFNSNHTPLNLSKQGSHEGVLLTLQTSDPAVTQNLAVLYCRNSTSKAGTQPQLFVRIPAFISGITPQNPPMQLTYNSVNTSGPQYQSFIPGGYIVYWGTLTLNTPTNIVLSPVPTFVVMAIAYAQDNFQPVGVSRVSDAVFAIVPLQPSAMHTYQYLVVAQA